MADDEEAPNLRDLRTIWRTLAIIVVCGATVAGLVFSTVIREVRQDTRIESLEEWRAKVEAANERAERREEWRRNRESMPFGAPKAAP